MKNSPLTIGLTGGIGSGKTTVARQFEALGIPVFYSDEEAKKCYSDPQIMASVAELAGDDVFQNGILDRKLLAVRIFASDDLRKRINNLIHPRVREAFVQFYLRNQHVPYIINEAAILFETGAYKNFNKTILVSAPEDVRLARVMQRDGAAENDIKQRMAAQWSDEQKRALADFTIENTDWATLNEQVSAIHRQLIRKAEEERHT